MGVGLTRGRYTFRTINKPTGERGTDDQPGCPAAPNRLVRGVCVPIRPDVRERFQAILQRALAQQVTADVSESDS